MRVGAILRHEPWAPLGAARMTRLLLEALAEAGAEVVGWSASLTERVSLGGVDYRPLPDLNPRRDRCEVIYSHPDAGTKAWLLAGRWSAPYVGMIHNTGHRNRHALTRYRPDLVVWNAEATRAAFGMSGGIVVRPPLALPASTAPSGDSVTLVNVSEDKGAATFYGLAERHSWPFLGIRGGYGKQDVRPWLAEISGPYRHESMRRYVWARTRVLLVPSLAESWGMAATEALAQGVPVVAHPTPGLVESLGDGGLFADRDDLDAWSETVGGLMEDPTTYAEARARARARAEALAAQWLSDRALFVSTILGA